ncbi:hypothetical protein [Leclercia sp.]|uniref:hypothetical protein n=1 Tax=Leclercia sp. TaxID=1898428 RepID=UPI002FDE331D
MKISCHLSKRMSQRNISLEILQMALSLGCDSANGERLILDEKTISMALKATEEIKKTLIKIKGKKGISLVIDRDSLITSFFHYGK